MANYGLLDTSIPGQAKNTLMSAFNQTQDRLKAGRLSDLQYQNAERQGKVQDSQLRSAERQGKLQDFQLQTAERNAAIDARTDAYLKSPEVQALQQEPDKAKAYQTFLGGLMQIGSFKTADAATEYMKSRAEADKPIAGSEFGLYDRSGKELVPPMAKRSSIAKLIAERDSLPPDTPPEVRTIYDNAIRKESETAKQISPTVIQEAPITPVTIQDPDNPGATIVIDGRTNRVLGKGPKLTQAGSAEQKLQLAQPQAKLRRDSVIQNLTRLDTAIGELATDPGLSHITGTIAGRTPNITNTATGAQAKLDSIKSQTFVSALQAMREASKTGGAVGNVSDREGDKLENTISAMGQAQGTSDFKKQLTKAREQLRLSKELINNAYEEQFGSVEAFAGPNSVSGPKAPSAPKGAAVPVRSEAEALSLPAGTRFKLPDGRTGTAQ